MEAVKCKGLSFTYPKSEHPALSDITFSVNEGELCVVMGKSAAGKSTLLKLMKKEIAPFGTICGTIEVNGAAGYVAQNIEENIVCDKVRSELSFALTNAGMSSSEIELLVAETASYFNLEAKLDSEIASLSGGEKQMVNLASVMIMKPNILILDEPTSQLDPISASRFIDMIKRMHRDFSTTILISEHSADAIFESANSVLVLENSKLVIKSDFENAVEYLRAGSNDMLKALPIQMHLYEGAKTVSECRRIFEKKDIKPLKYEDKRNETAMDIKNLFFSYNRGEDILSALSLKVYKGKINAVLGPNSSGKTTLFKVIAGVNRQYRGKIKTDGKISMLSQNVFDLFTKEKCSQEVAFGDVTDFLEIDDIKDRHPYDISGGQAQRLALAMVLEKKADIILLDEPTKGLDCVLKEKLAGILKALCDMGKTILIASHDIEFIGRYCDFASFLSRGKIIATKERRAFFSSLGFYTTTVSKITKTDIVSVDDLRERGGL